MKNRIYSIVSFLVLLITSFIYLNIIFSSSSHFNNTIATYDTLSEQTDIDVLFFGSSHSFTAYNPLIIDRESKTLSYNLGSDALRVPITDLMVKEALKKSTPKLIVIEIYPSSVAEPENKKSKGFQLRSLDVIPHFSIDKWKKVRRIFSSDEYLGVYFPLLRNHKDWYKKKLFRLSKEKKFDENKTFFYNGYYGFNKVLDSSKEEPYLDFKEKKNYPKKSDKIISEMAQKDIKAIIDIAKSKGSEVLVVSSPDLKSKYKWTQSFIDKLAAVCEENGASYLNLNDYYDEIDIRTTDFRDPSHLNVRGAYKTSQFMARYINTHYSLPDRSLDLDKYDNEGKYQAFLKKYIDVKGVSRREKKAFSFLENITVDSLYIERENNTLDLDFLFKKTEAFKADVGKYKISLNVFPESTDMALLSPRSKSKEWTFDKFDFELKDYDLEGEKGVFKCKIQTDILNIKRIEVFLYNKEKFTGRIGKKLIIHDVR